ncbi:MAG: Jag N-terminal domain-containing protein [Anaerolineae bacterium]|nr:Jag N-terminal domain-containing protein [Anaerolineae bacterium]
MGPEESVEITAPSVDEAIILGLTRLAATRDEVEIEVLEEERRGFLGIGARNACVRLTRRVTQVESPPIPEESVVVPVQMSVDEVVEPQPIVIEEISDAVPVVSVPAEIVEETRLPEREITPPVQAESEPAPPQSAPPAQTARLRDSRKEERVAESHTDLDREAIERTALEIAEHLFPELRVQASLRWKQEDRPTLWVSLHGRDADTLVGPRSQTLDAIQYLFRTIIHRKVEGDFNLVVDADGYRRRRRRGLESLARRMADQAVNTGRSVRLRPMPANERRVIHMLLRRDGRVRTESSGSGRHRAITIIPKRD